jgi:hypothetical protein
VSAAAFASAASSRGVQRAITRLQLDQMRGTARLGFQRPRKHGFRGSKHLFLAGGPTGTA